MYNSVCLCLYLERTDYFPRAPVRRYPGLQHGSRCLYRSLKTEITNELLHHESSRRWSVAYYSISSLDTMFQNLLHL